MTPPVESGHGADVRIVDAGSVVLFLLLTAAARAWVEAHVSGDPQMLGIGLAVEPRYAAALAKGMAGDGLTIEDDDPCPADADEARPGGCPRVSDDDLVEAVFTTPPQSPTGDRYDLGWLFTCWLWESGFGDWDRGVRVLARTLRGLERTGLIERRTIRRPGRPTHHGFALTDDGREAVAALSGHWIEEDHR
jgi:hypothetical protein